MKWRVLASDIDKLLSVVGDASGDLCGQNIVMGHTMANGWDRKFHPLLSDMQVRGHGPITKSVLQEKWDKGNKPMVGMLLETMKEDKNC
jgi:hypothetical protein